MTKTLATITPILKLTWSEIFELRNTLKTRFEYEIPPYYLSDFRYNAKAEIMPRDIKTDVDNIGNTNLNNSNDFYYLFDIRFDFPISEEVSNAGIESIFKGIDFSFILNLPNFLRYQEYINKFHEKASNYALLEYNYRNCGGYDDYEYDFDVSVLGYYDNDFNFNKLPSKYLYTEYFKNIVDGLEKVKIKVDPEKYNVDDSLYNRLKLDVEYNILNIRKETDIYRRHFNIEYSVLILDTFYSAWYPLHIFIPADVAVQREYKLEEILK